MNMLKSIVPLMLLVLASTAQAATDQADEAQCSILYAGQNTAVGTVCVTVNETDVNLDYLLIDDWVLTEAHAWIGDNLANMPQGATGNPKIGLFPHAVSGLQGVADYSFLIPISDLAVNADTFCNAEIFVAAHAVVKRPGVPVEDGGDVGDGEPTNPSESDGDTQSSKSSKSREDSGKSGKGTVAKNKNAKSAGKGYKMHDAKFGPAPASSDDSSDADTDDSDSGSPGQTESAWAGTISLGGGSWATYFSFENECGTTGEPEDPDSWLPVLAAGCSNVFALGETPFSSVGLTAEGSAGSIINVPESGSSVYTLSDGQTSFGSVTLTIHDLAREKMDFVSAGNLIISEVNIFAGYLSDLADINPETYPVNKLNEYWQSAFGHRQELNGGPALIIHAIVCDPSIVDPS